MPGGHTIRALGVTRAFLRQIDEKSCGKCLGIDARTVLARPESRENKPQLILGLKRIIPGLSWLDNPGEKKLMKREGAR